jgi:hypothetical protein
MAGLSAVSAAQDAVVIPDAPSLKNQLPLFRPVAFSQQIFKPRIKACLPDACCTAWIAQVRLRSPVNPAHSSGRQAFISPERPTRHF